MYRNLKILYFGFLALWLGYLLFSCSPQKRLNRLLDKHPELKADQTILIDTVLIATAPMAEISGIIATADLSDPVLYKKDQLVVEISSNDIGDTIYVTGKCDSIPVYVPFKKEIVVEKVIYKRPRDWLIWTVLFVLLALFVGFILGRKDNNKA